MKAVRCFGGAVGLYQPSQAFAGWCLCLQSLHKDLRAFKGSKLYLPNIYQPCLWGDWGVWWGSANTATHIVAPIYQSKACIIVEVMPSSNSWGSLREKIMSKSQWMYALISKVPACQYLQSLGLYIDAGCLVPVSPGWN